MTNTHGGKREGAGRKPLPPEQRKVRITAVITAGTAALLRASRHRDEHIGETLDRLVEIGFRGVDVQDDLPE